MALDSDQLLVTKPNSKVITLGVDHPQNKRGQAFQVYKSRKDGKAFWTPIALVDGWWHELVTSQDRTNTSYLKGDILADVHQYDITASQALDEGLAETQTTKHSDTGRRSPTDDTTDDERNKVDSLNEEIRNSPITRALTLPKEIKGPGNFRITTQAHLHAMTTMAETTTTTW